LNLEKATTAAPPPARPADGAAKHSTPVFEYILIRTLIP
jgi:hypothetical protein